MTAAAAPRLRAALLAVVLAATAGRAAALGIVWNYDFDSSGFFAPGSAARATLEAAGAWYETTLTDSLLAIAPRAGTSFAFEFRDPGLPGLPATTLANPALAADSVMIIVGATDLSAFGGSVLAVAEPGGLSWDPATPQSFVDELVARGQGASGLQGDVEGPTAHDVAPWGGWISIDPDWSWHADPFNLPVSGFDLYSVLLHELGHVLGVGTSDAWYNHAIGGFFLGPAATAVYGDAVPLQGPQDFHWSGAVEASTTVAGFEAGQVQAGEVQSPIFAPTFRSGQRTVLTELDTAALADIGWELSEDPPAAAGAPRQLPAAGLAQLVLQLTLTLAAAVTVLPRRH